MKKSSLISLAALAGASALVLTGCAGTDGDGGGGGGGTASTRACVILPDTESSDRWENGDRPALQKAFTDAGLHELLVDTPRGERVAIEL